MAADASEPDRVAVLHEDVAAVSVFVFRYVVVGFLRAACAALAAVPEERPDERRDQAEVGATHVVLAEAAPAYTTPHGNV